MKVLLEPLGGNIRLNPKEVEQAASALEAVEAGLTQERDRSSRLGRRTGASQGQVDHLGAHRIVSRPRYATVGRRYVGELGSCVSWVEARGARRWCGDRILPCTRPLGDGDSQ